jgi:DNA invertase Pin-like site-specific DNA recombinase
MTSAAIYARVSSARQRQDETIGSQTAARRAHAEQLGLDLPGEWVFEDDGHSGATLMRPALDRLRDLVAQVGVDVVLCYSPDRLARKFAYQALLIEEFTRAGTRVEFVQGTRGDSPEDQLLVQFQGMFAEYEKAQILERSRRGKAHRARSGSVNVLSGAPFGYRYVRKSDQAGAGYEIVGPEAVLVAEMFRRYADDGASIAALAGWLTAAGAVTRTGKSRWDRSVIWAMLRNPAYAGRAMFGKTMASTESPGLNRVARQQGRTTPRAGKTVDRPRADWVEIPVPAIVSAEIRAGGPAAGGEQAVRRPAVSVALRKIRAAGGRTPPRARSGHHLAVSRSDAPGTGRRSGGCRRPPRRIVEALPDGRRVQVGAEDAARTEAVLSCVLDVARRGLARRLGAALQANLLHFTCRRRPPGRGRCARPAGQGRLHRGHRRPSLRRARRRRLPAPGLPAHAGGCDLVHGHPRRSVARGAPARAGTGAGRAAGFAPQFSTTYASATSQPGSTSPTSPTGSGTGSASPSPETPDRLPAAPLPVPAVDPFRDTGVSQGSRPPPQGLRRSPASECRLTGQAG